MRLSSACSSPAARPHFPSVVSSPFCFPVILLAELSPDVPDAGPEIPFQFALCEHTAWNRFVSEGCVRSLNPREERFRDLSSISCVRPQTVCIRTNASTGSYALRLRPQARGVGIVTPTDRPHCRLPCGRRKRAAGKHCHGCECTSALPSTLLLQCTSCS